MRTLLTKARIRTMGEGRPKAEALVIEGVRIVAIGSAAGMAALAGKEAKVIDATCRLVLRGFQDAHIHLLNCGVDLGETAQPPRTLPPRRLNPVPMPNAAMRR